MDHWKTKEGKEILWRDLEDSHLECIIKGLHEGAPFGIRPHQRSAAIFCAEQELVKRELVKVIKNSPSLALLLTSPHKCLRDIAEHPRSTIENFMVGIY